MMKVKELKRELDKFDDNYEVVIEQEYNSSGGCISINRLIEHKYENETVLIEGKIW